MTKTEKEQEDILREAKILFVGAENYSDRLLIAYYKLCKDIFGNSLSKNRAKIILEKFEEVLNTFDWREIYVIDLRYGLTYLKKHTYSEIGKLIERSPTTAANICTHTIRKLRHHKNSVKYSLRIQERAKQRLAQNKL